MRARLASTVFGLMCSVRATSRFVHPLAASAATTVASATATATRTPSPTGTPIAPATRSATPTRTRTPTATPTPPPPTRCGDLDGDGRVTWRDVVIEALAVLLRRTDPRYDINRDGRVTAADLVSLATRLGRVCSARASVETR